MTDTTPTVDDSPQLVPHINDPSAVYFLESAFEELHILSALMWEYEMTDRSTLTLQDYNRMYDRVCEIRETAYPYMFPKFGFFTVKGDHIEYGDHTRRATTGEIELIEAFCWDCADAKSRNALVVIE